MGKKRISFIIILFLLILFPLVIAQPPPQTNINTNVGLTIDFPIIEVIKLDQTQTFNFHVFNISDGLRLDNSSVVCRFHLYNLTGFHIIETNMSFVTIDNDWEIDVLGANFSDVGFYSIQVNCNDGSFGGFVVFGFDVTRSGFNLEESQILYSVLLIVIFLLDLLFLFIIFSLGLENPRGEDDQFIGISLKKYIKVVMIGIFYGFILLTLNLMNAIAQSISGISQFAGIIGGVFLLMLGGAWVWTLAIIVWIGIMVWRDGNLIKEIEKKMNEMEALGK